MTIIEDLVFLCTAQVDEKEKFIKISKNAFEGTCLLEMKTCYCGYPLSGQEGLVLTMQATKTVASGTFQLLCRDQSKKKKTL